MFCIICVCCNVRLLEAVSINHQFDCKKSLFLEFPNNFTPTTLTSHQRLINQINHKPTMIYSIYFSCYFRLYKSKLVFLFVSWCIEQFRVDTWWPGLSHVRENAAGLEIPSWEKTILSAYIFMKNVLECQSQEETSSGKKKY